MSKKKVTFKWFDITDYEKEARYLSEMHRNGWKFVKAMIPGIYTFEACEPADVQYQLDYNKEGVDHMDEYVQMFADMGWEHILEFVGYSYFRKPVEEGVIEEDIFCDDESRLDMMKRIYKGRVLPLVIIFFLLIVPNLYRVFLPADSVHYLDSELGIIYAVLAVLYLLIFLRFGIRYYKLMKRE